MQIHAAILEATDVRRIPALPPWDGVQRDVQDRRLGARGSFSPAVRYDGAICRGGAQPPFHHPSRLRRIRVHDLCLP